MRLKQLANHMRPPIGVLCLYLVSLVLKAQSSGEGSMTQFYVVAIVFAVIILAALISFFISQKKKRGE